MIVCICNKVSSTSLHLAIQEAPIYPVSPYSRDYISSEDQIYTYAQKTLDIGTNCANCEIFIRQVIRDYLKSDSYRGV